MVTLTFRACVKRDERHLLLHLIDGRIIGAPAVQKALDQIDAVRENVKKYSNDMVLARTADDVRRAHAQGKIAALMAWKAAT